MKVLQANKMEVRIVFVFVVFTQWSWAASITRSASGEISEDVKFIHKTFPVPPSIIAIIQVDVFYPVDSDQYLTMGIYTTQDHVNLRKQCTERSHGQLGNEYLHPVITRYRDYSGRMRFKGYSANMCHYTGNITVQDFIPRNFSFLFGFRLH